MLVLWIMALGCLMGCCRLQPIDGFDDEIPLSDMDILTVLNPEQTEEGERIVEGDIVMPDDGDDDGDDNSLEQRKGLLNVFSLWAGGRVSYNFHSSVNKQTRLNIRTAMDEWEKKTCLRFREVILDLFYVRFRTDRGGCWSMVGRQNSPFVGQDVSIGPGCERVHIVVHEIGHAFGLYHEQSRLDRDSFITILWNNVPTGLQSQFATGMEFSRGVEYDYTSVMHYSSMAFTKQLFQKNTIVTRNPHYQRLLGTGRDISFRDAKLANRMYSCNILCPNIFNETQCLNEGYLSQYQGDGKPCHCICPPETTGEFCENFSGRNYYSPPICGGNITEETEIQTPGYPRRELPNDSCSWWIQAPPLKRVLVTFEDFSFWPRLNSRTSKYRGRCMQERVEVRTRNMAEGNMYCGEDIARGTNLASLGREFIIIITTNSGSQSTRGLKAKVKFIDL